MVIKLFKILGVGFLLLNVTVVSALEVTDQSIKHFLSGATIDGNQNGTEWTQMFDANGATTYTQVAGRPSAPSQGYWRVQNNQYCSQWPPSQSWDCYNVELSKDKIVFIPASGGDHWPAVKRQ